MWLCCHNVRALYFVPELPYCLTSSAFSQQVWTSTALLQIGINDGQQLSTRGSGSSKHKAHWWLPVAQEQWGEAARKMAELVDDDSFRSLEGKSKHQLWLELCDIITKHPKEVSGLRVDAILRSGIRKFTDEVRSSFHCCACTPVSRSGVL